jgi:hypothetical protein
MTTAALEAAQRTGTGVAAGSQAQAIFLPGVPRRISTPDQQNVRAKARFVQNGV